MVRLFTNNPTKLHTVYAVSKRLAMAVFVSGKSERGTLGTGVKVGKMLFLFLLLLVGAESVSGAKTWNGSSSNNWNTAANWTPSGVPGSSDDVIINSNATISVNANPAIKSITINNNAAVTFTSLNKDNGTITIYNNGSLIEAGSSLTLYGSTGNGNRSMNILFTGTNSTMSIAGTLTLTAVGEGTLYNATNSLTTVSGTIINDDSAGGTIGIITSTAANLSFLSSGTYKHAMDGGTIPTATWDANSTCLVTGVTTTITGSLPISILSGSSVDFGTSVLDGANATFTLNSGGSIITANPNGLTTSGSSGTIQVGGTRTYNAGANYTYNGTVNQVTGNGLIQNTPANLTINNSAGVTLSATTTISGLLTMTNGTLNMANTNLTVGSLTGTGNLTHSSGTAAARTLTIGTDNTSPAAYSGIISNGTATSVSLTKVGTGTLTFSGANNYTGATTISAGTLQLNNSAALGNTIGTSVTSGATLDLNGITLSSAIPLTLNGTGVSSVGALINNSGTSSSFAGDITGTYSVGGTGNISLTGNVQGTLTKIGTNALTLGGIVDNIALGVIANSGTVVLSKTSSASVHAIGGGGLIINGSTVQLSGTGGDQLYNGGNVTLNGGTFTTGATTGFGDAVNTLALTDNSTVLMGTGLHSINFAASNGVSWTAGKMLTITGWTGNYDGTTGTAGKVFVGNSSGGLTSGQLAQIQFKDVSNNLIPAIQLSTGEVVAKQPISLATDYFRSKSTGNWSTAGSWQSSPNNITWITSTLVPTSAATSITIQSPHTITVDVNNQTASSIVLASGSTLVGGSNTLLVSGDWTNNGGTFTSNTSTVNMTGSNASNINGSSNTTFYNLTINKGAAATAVTSSSKVFSVNGSLNISFGKLVLQATDGDYRIAGDLTVNTSGTLQHSVDRSFGLLSVGGNISILGAYNHSGVSASQVQMSGVDKTISTGTSSLNMLTLENQSGTITANGPVTVDNNFWASFHTSGGTFSTGNNTVTANGGLFNAGGTIRINGGTLNVTSGLYVGFDSNSGNVILSSGTLNVDNIIVSDVSTTGTFSQSGGTVNISGNLTINPYCSYTCTNSPVINIGGNWINNGGTFTPAFGTVNFTGSSSVISGTNVTQTFKNLIVNKTSGQTLSVGGSTTSLSVLGNYTETTGNFTAPSTMSIGGDLTLTAGTYTAGTNLTVSGNWTNNGGSFTAGAGTVTLIGTTKTIGGSQQTTFNDLSLSGTASISTGVNTAVGGNLTVGIGTTLSTASNYTLSVTGATNISGTLTDGSTGVKTFTGDITLNSGSVWNETAASTYSIAGNLTNNGASFTASTGVHTFSGTGKTISGTSATSIPSVTITGTITNNGNLIVNTALSGTGALTNAATGILKIGGTSTITTLTATAVGNTVNYTGVAQTAKPITYSNLTLSGSGAVTTTSVTVNGILSLEGTATVTAAPTYGPASTLQYNTATPRTSGIEWITPFTASGGIIISNTGKITLNSAKVINNALTMTNGAMLSLGTWTTSTANTFVIGATTQKSGSWGSTASTASNKNNTFFDIGATGIITIATNCTAGIWIGSTSTDWNIASNWCDGNIPLASTNVVISSGVNYPVIGAAAVCNSITINAGASLTITGSNTLTVSGSWTNNGTFIANTSTVNFNSSAAATIGASNFYNITFTGAFTKTATGNLTIAGNWTDNSTFISSTGTVTMNGASAQAITGTAAFYNLTLSGTGTKTFTLGSTSSTNILTVNSGATLLLTAASSYPLTPASAVINGTIVLQGSATLAKGSGVISFSSGSNYQHNRDGGTIPTAIWDQSSTCLISGITNTVPTIVTFNQSFGNFSWNCPSQNATISLNNNLTTITGNFTVTSTNSKSLQLFDGSLSTRTLNVGGNLSMSASGGTLDLNYGNNSNVSILNVAGNFSITNGTITESNSGTGPGAINFNGTAPQTYTSGGIVSNTINFTVNSGATLQMAVNGTVVSGGGFFTMQAAASPLKAATLGVTSVDGITTGTGAVGNIQVTGTRTYVAGGNYIYNGTAAQVTGNGLTQNIPANLTINNSTGVTLSATTTLSGVLTLTGGTLTTTSSNLLTLTNTSPSAISGGTATSFINGPVIWTLPANLVSGSTYIFPVGKGTTYLPFSLVNPTTSGTATAKVEAFATGPTGGTPGAGVTAISSTQYWMLTTTGSYTNSSVSIARTTPAISPSNVVATCATLGGAYSNLGGTFDTYGVYNSNTTTNTGVQYFDFATGNTASMNVSTNVLHGMIYNVGSGPSNELSFKVSGISLTGNIIVTPTSSNFEISTVSGGIFQTTPITLTSVSGMVNTTIYVRETGGLAIGYYASPITVANSDLQFTAQSISCYGTVLPVFTAGGGGSYCVGNSITLTNSNVTNQYWTGPNNYYSLLQSSTIPATSTTLSGTYTVTGSTQSGSNLVLNGDFSLGDGVNFTTTYTPSTGSLVPEGRYAVIASPYSQHTGFCACGDNTTGTGLQMVVNGAPAIQKIWSPSSLIPVTPYTDYQFTYWIQTVNNSDVSPSKTQLQVNGFNAGPSYTANPNHGNWTQFLYNWNSGSSTTANLALMNMNTDLGGNDFALDDIDFHQVYTSTASVNVTVLPLGTPASVSISASANPVNAGQSVTLTAIPTNGGNIPPPTYQWSVSGVPVTGATSATYTYIPNDRDVVSCTMTPSTSTCGSQSPVSSSLTINVNASVMNYWIGTNSTNWGDASNWKAGIVPGNGDNVEFATTTNNSGSQAINNLRLDVDRTIGNLTNATTGPIRQLIIPPARILTVNGSIITPDNDPSRNYIQAYPDGTQQNGSLIFNNTQGTPAYGTVEMYSMAYKSTKPDYLGYYYKWQYFGIPIDGVTANPTFNGSYLRQWVESGTTISNHWVSVGNSFSLLPGIGYELTQDAAKTIVFKGRLRNWDWTSDQLPYTPFPALFPGQSILANPYTAAIDITKVQFGSDMQQSVWLYSTGSFGDWNTTSNAGQYTVVVPGLSGLGMTSQIPSMQGILVQFKPLITTSSSNSWVKFPYSSVTKNVETQRVKGTFNSTSSDKVGMRIDVTGSITSDKMWLFSQKDCTRNFDNGWDGTKKMGSAMTPQIFAIEQDGNYQIDAVDDINNTILGFQAGQDTEYALTFTHQNIKNKYAGVFLYDIAENKTVDITQDGSTYSFKAESTPLSQKRFIIVARNIENDSTGNHTQLKVFTSGNSVFVQNLGNLNGEMSLYDMMGRQLKKATFGPYGVTAIQVSTVTGAYIVNASTANEKVSEKFIIGK